jgi:hypothetical protein
MSGQRTDVSASVRPINSSYDCTGYFICDSFGLASHVGGVEAEIRIWYAAQREPLYQG